MTDFVLAAPADALSRTVRQTYRLRLPSISSTRDIGSGDVLWLAGRRGARTSLVARLEIDSVLETNALDGKRGGLLLECSFVRSIYFQDGSRRPAPHAGGG